MLYVKKWRSQRAVIRNVSVEMVKLTRVNNQMKAVRERAQVGFQFAGCCYFIKGTYQHFWMLHGVF